MWVNDALVVQQYNWSCNLGPSFALATAGTYQDEGEVGKREVRGKVMRKLPCKSFIDVSCIDSTCNNCSSSWSGI